MGCAGTREPATRNSGCPKARPQYAPEPHALHLPSPLTIQNRACTIRGGTFAAGGGPAAGTPGHRASWCSRRAKFFHANEAGLSTHPFPYLTQPLCPQMHHTQGLSFLRLHPAMALQLFLYGMHKTRALQRAGSRAGSIPPHRFFLGTWHLPSPHAARLGPTALPNPSRGLIIFFYC